MKQVCAQDVKHDGKSEPDRRSSLLKAWKQMKGTDATYTALIAAFLELERRDDAEIICNIIKESKLTASTTPVHTPIAEVPAASGNTLRLYINVACLRLRYRVPSLIIHELWF